MKMQHSKAWYKKHVEAEGNAEIGAGIPPWVRLHTGRERQAVSTVLEIQKHEIRKVSALHGRRHEAHRAEKVLSHA
jgi:hypothetical protein